MCLGGRTIDFVRQQNVGKNRPRLKVEEFFAHCVFLDDIRAGDIGRHEVRCELNAGKLQVHDICERGDQLCFTEARHTFQKHVTAGKQAHDDAIDDVSIPDDDFRNFLFDLFELFLERGNLLIDGSTHLL